MGSAVVEDIEVDNAFRIAVSSHEFTCVISVLNIVMIAVSVVSESGCKES